MKATRNTAGTAMIYSVLPKTASNIRILSKRSSPLSYLRTTLGADIGLLGGGSSGPFLGADDERGTGSGNSCKNK
jgi:hypothetical protein